MDKKECSLAELGLAQINPICSEGKVQGSTSS